MALAFEDLRRYDPDGGTGDREKRYLCPLCGDDKPRDAGHRSLALNDSTGAWRCFRCGTAGLLRDKWTEREPMPAKARARVKLQTWAAAASRPPAELPDESRAKLRELLAGCVALEGTAGAAYLAGRGLDLETVPDVRFHADWYGGPAVVFAIRDRDGRLVAAQGRSVRSGAKRKPLACGKKSFGVYATPGAFNRHVLVVTEAPIDALSLWTCGVPAVALIGTDAPEWLARAGAFRSVFLALDADEAGDRAADKLRPTFEALGATVTRLRPPIGKDWNDGLMEYNQDGMTAWLQVAIGSELLEAAREGSDYPQALEKELFTGEQLPRGAWTSEGDPMDVLKSTGKSNAADAPPTDLPLPSWALDPAWDGLEARRLWWRIARGLVRQLEAGADRDGLELLEAEAVACVEARDLEGLRNVVNEVGAS